MSNLLWQPFVSVWFWNERKRRKAIEIDLYMFGRVETGGHQYLGRPLKFSLIALEEYLASSAIHTVVPLVGHYLFINTVRLFMIELVKKVGNFGNSCRLVLSLNSLEYFLSNTYFSLCI